jgi:dihydroorotate dehydrogenase electron transfer subunit
MHTPIKKCLQKAQVVWNRSQGPGYYRMGVLCDGDIGEADPGQFLMVRLEGQQTPLLRRPFSIHQVIAEKGRIKGFEILYKVVGDGTTLLARARQGDGIDVLGPLGKSFTMHPGHNTIFCVAGGIGVAPFLFLAARMSTAGFDMSGVSLFLGGRTENDLLCVEDFSALGLSPTLTTEDGSRGKQGLITGPLEKAISTSCPDMLYACGPLPMLREVMAIAADHGLPCQVSIETIMACGMGACLGCAVKDKRRPDAYRHACVDGPVFDAEEIVL